MNFRKRILSLVLCTLIMVFLGINVHAASVADLMQNAIKPIGKCLYVYGGGWNEPDTGAGQEAMQLGLGANWEIFYNSKNSQYDYKTTRYQIHDGLDCTGYVGWCMYQLFQNQYSEDGYVYLASEMAKRYADVFYGTYTSKEKVTKRRCGDVMSSGGHAYIVVGECADGSVVLLHASPPAVSLCGTATPAGNKNSEAIRLAEFYMNNFFKECYTKYPNYSRGSDYLVSYNQMSWNASVLKDSDGYREMTAEEILKDMFYNIKIYLQGERIAKEKSVYAVNGTTFIPVRVVCEKLGATVLWDDGKVTVSKGETSVELQIDSNIAKINGVNTTLNHNVFLADSTTYVPLRVVAEAFGLQVDWNGDTKAVLLN